MHCWALCAHLLGIINLKFKNGVLINTISSFVFTLFYRQADKPNVYTFLSIIGKQTNFWIKLVQF